ncbi:MAG TPA: spore coat associated protein CotJA [Ruminiclostridium sp.]|nr:spore coat associated protein CotJA [Ruminiclostridium sp.]
MLLILKGVIALIPDDVFSQMYPMQPDKTAFPAQTPIAMAYVPFQQLSAVYDENAGFKIGTIFPDLDKPWLDGGGDMK